MFSGNGVPKSLNSEMVFKAIYYSFLSSRLNY